MLFTENLTNEKKPTGMCIAWFSGQLSGKKYFAHAGGGGGYYVEIRIYPDLGMGSLVFFNRTGMSDERFLDKVDKIYFGKIENQYNNPPKPPVTWNEVQNLFFLTTLKEGLKTINLHRGTTMI